MVVPIPNTGRTAVAVLLRTRLDRALRAALTWTDSNVGRRRCLRSTALLLAYTLELSTAFWLAYEVRWDFAVRTLF
jgi:hypothetical protein